ncbi:UPF0415 protein C7orf25 homolog isoform X2 [Lytechinus pictus]|uniref:UPF0415 protein C7orf25 homolog isoform X2 n=1 Tax=Lytechinus pictus TaxID=7653 RepID=UPI0030B9C5E0
MIVNGTNKLYMIINEQSRDLNSKFSMEAINMESSLAGELSALRDRAEDLMKRADLLKANGNIAGIGKVKKKIQSELTFIKSLQEGKVLPKKNQLKSTNLSHLDALLHTVETFDHVTAVLRPVHYETEDGYVSSLLVDVVGHKGKSWVKITARKAEALHRIWEGEGEYGEQNIVQQVAQYQDASRQNLIDFSPPAVHVVFYSGITQEVSAELFDLGAVVHGHIYQTEEEMKNMKPDMPVFQHEEEDSELPPKSDSIPQAANMDVTTMIALVSDLCHGGSSYSFNEPVIEELSQQERQKPLLPELENFLKDKELIACETAKHDFQAILETIGGSREKERAEELLQRLHIVPDQPSSRTLMLASSNRIKDRAKVIFGTGDALKMITTTANEAFVRAASKQGVAFSVFIHQSRALTEKKQQNPAKASPSSSSSNCNSLTHSIQHPLGLDNSNSYP